MTSRGRARANGEGSIFPRGRGFAAYVWVTTPTGERKRKYVYGKDRETVHGKWVELHRAAAERPVPSRVPTVGQWLATWLAEEVRPNLAPATAENYAMFVRLYIAPALGSIRLDRLSVGDVQRWLNALRVQCQCCAQGKDAARPPASRRCCAIGECCESPISSRSVSDVRAALRSALSSAMDRELITRNPATRVKLPAARKKRRKAWTSEQARRFLEHTKTAEDGLYAAFVLVLVLGLRRGEVLGLAWDDLDLDGGELTVGLQIQRVGGELLHRQTKTEGSDVTLPLPGICLTALRWHRGRQDEARQLAGRAWQDEVGLAFTTRYGTPIEPRNMLRSFHRLSAAAGVPDITVHDARRTCATLLVDLDVHPRVIMQILRHAQISVTMEIYSQAPSSQTREALRRLSDSLDG
jgi:integrase